MNTRFPTGWGKLAALIIAVIAAIAWIAPHIGLALALPVLGTLLFFVIAICIAIMLL